MRESYTMRFAQLGGFNESDFISKTILVVSDDDDDAASAERNSECFATLYIVVE